MVTKKIILFVGTIILDFIIHHALNIDFSISSQVILFTTLGSTFLADYLYRGGGFKSLRL